MSRLNEPPPLSKLGSPAQLRRIPLEKLPQLAMELRRDLVDRAGPDSGDMAAGLASVELAIALHYAYRTPQDRLIWDGGLHTFLHRALTGPSPRRPAVRARTRMAPATPLRSDRKYEQSGAGHASTSISVALGMATAAALQGVNRHVAAVISDRALRAGMAFEALNHAGFQSGDLLVVLNDSDESQAGGADPVSGHFARAFSGSLYGHLRAGGKRMLRQLPTMTELARRSEKHLKGMVLPGTLFEELGFKYTGPLDGHDVEELVRTLRKLQKLPGRQFLHVVTGGHSLRHRNSSVPLMRNRRIARVPESAPTVPAPAGRSFEGAFGRWLCDMAVRDPGIVCVSASSVPRFGESEFAARFPGRYFHLPNTEQHAVTFAAGMAAAGRRPVVSISSSLLQRAYDQVVHDVALQHLPVLFAVYGAGMSDSTVAGYHGSFDISYLRCVPGLTIATPGDENECRQLLFTASTLPGPTVVRFPNGSGPEAAEGETPSGWPVGRGEIRREGRSGLALLVFGAPLAVAQRVAQRLDATLVSMRFVKPLDEQLLQQVSSGHRALVTIEENSLRAGAGSAVGEALAMKRVHLPLLQLGIPDHFMPSGTREACLAAAGLDFAGLSASIERWWRTQQLQLSVAEGA